MRTHASKQSASFIVLCASLIVVTVLFGLRVKYTPAVPWIIPLLFGVALLRRAGSAGNDSAT
jgi:hypothetical protein